MRVNGKMAKNINIDGYERVVYAILVGCAIGIAAGFIAVGLWGCSTQPPEDVQALQSVMQDPNVPLNVKGQYLNWWNAEKDEQRAQMQRNYENALNLGMMTGAMSRTQPIYAQPIVPSYTTPAAMPYINYGGR